MPQTVQKMRFRRSSAITVAAVIMMVAGLSLATWAPYYLLPVLVIPALVAIWSWRAGTDVDADAITVHAAIGSRRVPWSEIDGFIADQPGRVVARLHSGSGLTLTGVHPRDLPRVVALSGQDLVRED